MWDITRGFLYKIDVSVFSLLGGVIDSCETLNNFVGVVILALEIWPCWKNDLMPYIYGRKNPTRKITFYIL